MNFKEYRTFTPVTMADTGSIITDSAHMTLGMNTEIMGEMPQALSKMDEVNFKEEVGDAFWYVSNYCNLWNLEPVYLIKDNEKYRETFGVAKLDNKDGQQFMLIFGLAQSVALLQDLDKKHLAYGKKGDDAVRQELINDIYTMLLYICHIYGYDVEKILDRNIEKLEARYPNLRFEAEKANTRDLDVEREILEKED